MRALINGLLLAGLCSPVFANPEYDEFARQLAEKHQFDPAVVLDTLGKAQKSQAILDAIARPWEAKPWYQYYPIFLTDKRISKGAEFWLQHEDTLARAERETGVPAQIIVAIIGVETFYGTYKGKYPVLDALYTLGFYYPPRSAFFRSELEQYFLLSREEGFDMTALKGSYAGAMGWGQFISSSYRHYAVDFDGDGIRDLHHNPVDAIGSVANYFVKHGWQKGQPVIYPAVADSPQAKAFASDGLTYKDTWADMKKAGVTLSNDGELADDTSVRLFALDQPEGPEYWVGLKNFYVITRYNHSPLYAMAVYQLSERIKEAKGNL